MKVHAHRIYVSIVRVRLPDIGCRPCPSLFRVQAVVVFLLALTVIAVAGSSGAFAETPIDDRYDENTEIIVKGTVVETIIPSPRGMGKGRGGGPVILSIKTRNKSYSVVTAPLWYLERQGIAFKEGAVMEVRGSRYYSDEGTVYLIAREIRDASSSKTVFFRDSKCRAMWHGQRMMNRQGFGH